MARAEIYINDTLADYDKIDLSFVYTVDDLDGAASGSHSKRNIKLPATKNNNEIFSNANILSVPQNLNDGLLSLPCRIVIDGLVLFVGTCQIDKATISRLNSNYEVLFLSDNSNWIEPLRNVGMDSIVMPTTIDYTGQNVVAFYSSHNRFDGFCFFVPKTAAWNRIGQVRTDEYYPAIFIDYIFQYTFKTILGYTINSEFFDTTLWKGLIVPVLCRNYDTKWLQTQIGVEYGIPHVQSLNVYNGAYYIIAFENVVSVRNQTRLRTRTNLGNIYTYNTFRPIITGRYKFDGELYSAAGALHKMYIYVNGAFVINLNGGLTQADGSEIDLKAGDEVEFLVDITYVPHATIFTGGYMNIKYIGLASVGNVPNVTIGNYYPYNAIYELNQLCGKWQLLDIIKDIQKAFNLVFVTDTYKKEVTIEPRDFWNAIADGVLHNGNGAYSDGLTDVTNKLDISKDVVYEFGSDKERYIEFNYKGDDPTVKGFEAEREGVKLYSYQFDRGERFKKDTKEVNLEFFNKCMHIIDSKINKNITSFWGELQLPLLYSVNYYEEPNPTFPDYNNLTPYLLWFYGRWNPTFPPNEGAAWTTYDPITHALYTNYGIPTAWITLYNDHAIYSDYSANLSYSKEGYSHSIISSFHYRDLERQTQEVKLSAYMNWSNIDIFNLNFRKKYVINGSTLILKDVDGYNPLTGTTTKTNFLLDGRLMGNEDNETGTQEIESSLKGLIKI